MKNVTGETATIQALRGCLEETLFLQVMEVSLAANASAPDFRMDIRVQGRPLTFLAESKASGHPGWHARLLFRLNTGWQKVWETIAFLPRVHISGGGRSGSGPVYPVDRALPLKSPDG
jgi:hypothetical protein